MSVLRGSFRLSVVIALVALLCSAVYAHFTALDAEQQAAESWRTLRCGQMFLNRDMGDYTNQYGLIDIGTAGCSYKGRFLATPDEIRAAVSSPPPESKYGEAFQQMLSVLILRAVLGVFLLVNLLGLLFLAARGALRWVPRSARLASRCDWSGGVLGLGTGGQPCAWCGAISSWGIASWPGRVGLRRRFG